MSNPLRAFGMAMVCAALAITPIALGCGGGSGQVKKTAVKKKARKKGPPSPFASARTSLPTCDSLVDQAESLISPSFGRNVRAALTEAAPSYGQEAAARVLPRVLEHGVVWARSSAALCMRHVSQAAISETEYRKRLACHGEAFARLRSLANALEHADGGVVEWALPTVAELDELLAQCARPGVWKGYDADPVSDAELIQAMADLTILELMHRTESLGSALQRAQAEAQHTRSRTLQARVLVRSAAGRSQELAEQGLEKALELFEHAGTLHGHMLVHGAAARLYMELDQPADALGHAAEQLAHCESVHGAASLTCAAERRRSTLILARAGRPKEALAAARKALSAVQRAVGDMHPQTLVSRIALASLELQFGSADKAEKLVRTSIEAAASVYGPGHPLLGDQLRIAARIAYKRGGFAEAMQRAEKALAIHRAAHGDVHRRVADDFALVGRIARKTGDGARAAQAYEMALTIQRRLHGGGSPALARALRDAAKAFIELGNPPPKVLKWLERARAMDEELLGEDDTQVAVDLRLLGLYWAAKGKHRKAYNLHLESVKRLNNLHGPDHPETRRSTAALDAAVRGQGI